VTRQASDLPIVLVPHPHVRVDKTVLGGSPYVDGSRVPVRRLWGFYRSGAGVETLIRRFPKLGAAKIFDALAFAWDNQEVIEADIARENVLLEKDGARPGSSKQSTQMAFPFDATAAPPKAKAGARAAPAKAPPAKAPNEPRRPPARR
jgi:uncharacterized protein (DUF433 family)